MRFDQKRGMVRTESERCPHCLPCGGHSREAEIRSFLLGRTLGEGGSGDLLCGHGLGQEVSGLAWGGVGGAPLGWDPGGGVGLKKG